MFAKVTLSRKRARHNGFFSRRGLVGKSVARIGCFGYLTGQVANACNDNLSNGALQ